MMDTKFDKVGVDVMKSIGIGSPELIGRGDQAWVFKYKPGLVVKVYRDANEKYLKCLSSF